MTESYVLYRSQARHGQARQPRMSRICNSPVADSAGVLRDV